MNIITTHKNKYNGISLLNFPICHDKIFNSHKQIAMYHVYRCDRSSSTNHLKDLEDQDNRCFNVYLVSHNRSELKNFYNLLPGFGIL